MYLKLRTHPEPTGTTRKLTGTCRNHPEPPGIPLGTLTENRNNKNQIKVRKEQNQNNKNQLKISSFRLKKAATVRHMTNGVRILSWPKQKKRK